MFKQLHPNIRMRIYTSFMSRVIGSMIFPFIAIYFTNELNAALAGILLMVNVIVQFVASLYGGYLADTLGRKRMMVTGELLKVLAFLGMLMANSPWWHSPWITFVMFVISGSASGLIGPAANAMLVDVSTKENRAFMYSINYWAVNMSLMLGLIVGGWLFEEHFFGLLIGLLTMELVTLWMTAALIKETYKSTSTGIRSYGIKPIIQSYQKVIRDWPFVLFTLGGIAVLSIEFQRNNFIAVRLKDEIIPRAFSFFGQGSITIDGVKLLSLLTLENTIIIVLFTAFVAKWITNRRQQPIMYTGFILFGLGYAILAFSNSIPELLFGVVVLSAGELMYVPTRQTVLAEMIDDTQRGAYMAFNGFVFQTGKMIGAASIIIGETIGGIGMAGMYVVFALVGILLVRLAIQKKNGKSRSLSATKVI